MNITITATTTQSEEAINNFALANGYQTQINQLVDVETTINGVTTTTQQNQLVPNPLTKTEFVCEFFRKLLAEIMVRPTREAIFRQAQETAQAEVNAVKEQVEQSLTVEAGV